VGYPVVLKAQAAALTHKTQAGGVALDLSDARAQAYPARGNLFARRCINHVVIIVAAATWVRQMGLDSWGVRRSGG
jgi:ATP-grasp domain